MPVLRDVQSMNYLDIEKGINDLGEKVNAVLSSVRRRMT